MQNGESETTTYQYDDLDRLTEYTITGADTIVTAYTYEGYNRKTETVTTNGTVTKDRTYTYDETDWMTVIDDTTDTANPYTIAYTYDSNGNTLTKSNSSLTDQDETFAYDALNRLVEATQGPSGSETVLGRYDYNAGGLRVRHLLSERGNVEYFYDDNAVIEEHNADDDSLLAHYRYADRLISLDTGAGKEYYHHDALGSTVNLTTDAAVVQVSYKLDPWGNVRDQVGSSINRQVFTGQEMDENTGLIYFGARYYDPDTARFLTQDSYLGGSSTPPSLNRYLYAYSNPTIYIDLYGYEAVREWDSTSDIPTDADYIEYEGRYINPDADAWEDDPIALQIYTKYGESKTMERGWFADKANLIGRYWKDVTDWRNGEPTMTVEDARGEDQVLENPIDERKANAKRMRQWMGEQANEVGRNVAGEYIDTIEENKNNPGKAAALLGAKALIEKKIPGYKRLKRGAKEKVSNAVDSTKGFLKKIWRKFRKKDIPGNVSEKGKTLIVPKEKADVFADWQKAASEGTLVRTDPKTVRGSGFRKRVTIEQGPPPGSDYDADHKVELCVGGADCEKTNAQWLQSSANRASGPKVYNQVKDDEIGTVYTDVIMEE